MPFRNGIFTSIATAHALQVGVDTVMIGVHAEDSRNWAYPDCSTEFVGAMSCAVYIGTYQKVRLVAPLVNFTKADVVRESARVFSPIHLTRSCYTGKVHSCGVCPTCRSRLEAFRSLGMIDPIEYES